ENDLSMTPGESATLAGYQFTFHGVHQELGPNYTAQVGRFTVQQDSGTIAQLTPAKRHYHSGGQAMTESGIAPGVFRDLYVSLGQPQSDNVWSVRLYYKPFVRWIWAGGMLMALGGFLALSDKRYWRGKRAQASQRVSPVQEVQV